VARGAGSSVLLKFTFVAEPPITFRWNRRTLPDVSSHHALTSLGSGSQILGCATIATGDQILDNLILLSSTGTSERFGSSFGALDALPKNTQAKPAVPKRALLEAGTRKLRGDSAHANRGCERQEIKRIPLKGTSTLIRGWSTKESFRFSPGPGNSRCACVATAGDGRSLLELGSAHFPTGHDTGATARFGNFAVGNPVRSRPPISVAVKFTKSFRC
jgi:hypothetical protein